MNFEQGRHGRASQTGGNHAIAEAWGRAAQMPAGPPPPGEWVPWMSVWIKDGVSPRATNQEAVERYAAVFAELPPITVQRDTFALIDGRHRLEAAQKAASDFIRIVEADVDDAELAVRAFIANLEHGVAYVLSERVTGLKLLLQAEPYRSMSTNQLAKLVGLNYDTVAKHKRGYVQTEVSENHYRQNEPTNFGEAKNVPLSRVGADGKSYPPTTNRPTNTDLRKLPNNGRDLRREPIAEAQGWPDDDLPVRQDAWDEDETFADGNMVFPDDWGERPNELRPDEGDGAAFLPAPSEGGGERVSLPRDPAPATQAPAPAERGTVPPMTDALPDGAARDVREDLEHVIWWLKAMPNVGDAAVMVAACRDGGEQRLVHFLALGGVALCADMINALTAVVA